MNFRKPEFFESEENTVKKNNGPKQKALGLFYHLYQEKYKLPCPRAALDRKHISRLYDKLGEELLIKYINKFFESSHFKIHSIGMFSYSRTQNDLNYWNLNGTLPGEKKIEGYNSENKYD